MLVGLHVGCRGAPCVCRDRRLRRRDSKSTRCKIPPHRCVLGGLALDNSQQYVGVSDVAVFGERALHRRRTSRAPGNRCVESGGAGPYRTVCHHGERDGSDHSRADRLRRYFAGRSNRGCEQPSRDLTRGVCTQPLRPSTPSIWMVTGSTWQRPPITSISLTFPTERRRASLAG